ncbi:SAP domain-containing protein [Patescibacteria group bacterium]|nr:SAP domain-containing protein [Patescibacteria group bacterium]
MLVSKQELTNLKLQSIKVEDLKELAGKTGTDSGGNKSDIIKRLIDAPQNKIDEFIQNKYQQLITERQVRISDEDLKKELMKVEEFRWSVVQGQLDQKIQTEYVRRFTRYGDLLSSVKSKLHDDVTGYVIATWYNHWTTVLIEDQISQHKRVIPTLANLKGVDIFFDNQPFDLKTTYLPKDYPLEEAIRYPKDLIVWLYENQGPQRFGSHNRLFVVLANKDNLEDSWKLKRDFGFVFGEINKFFNSASVSEKDEIIFSFNKKTYTTISKILIITK